MQLAPEEVEQSVMRGSQGLIPQHHPIRDVWFAVVNLLVRLLTFGKGRMVASDGRLPIHWNGIIK